MSDFENKYNPEPWDSRQLLRKFKALIRRVEWEQAQRRPDERIETPSIPDGPSLNLVVEGDVAPVEDV